MVGTLLKRGALTGVAVIGLEAAYAVLRPSPELESFDPSSEFGDPGDPTLRVAVLGDSSVNAPGVSGPDEIWVSRVCERLAVDRHVVLQSFAVGGSMAHDVIADQLHAAIGSRPELVFLSVGANDVIKGVPRNRFAANLDQLVSELAATGAIVVQSGVGVMGSVPRLYPPLSTLMSRRAERFDQVHWEVAARHGTHVVDQRSDDTGVWFRDRSLWAEDLFHVSAAGHARWAETAWRTVGPLFDGPDGPA
ncbi:MAG: SGNH/GDSL hydrolase family protein [Acidimicrobiia bacterium]|jgi:lysophospholipase L1-like esterase